MASLPLLIYTELTNPLPAGQFRIWGAALTLILIIGAADPARRPRLAPCWRRRTPRSAGSSSWPSASRSRTSTSTTGPSTPSDSVTMTVPRRVCHRAHRTLRLRQVHRAAHPQPDARGDPRRPRRGPGPARRRGHLQPGPGPRSRCAAPSAWCSSARTRSPRCRSATTSSPGSGCRASGTARQLDEVAERALRGANLWNEVKDRLGKPGRRPVRRSAAAAVHRPGDRRPARRAADGRALLGARPDLHPGGRGPDRRAQGRVHDRHRHPQHAAGRAGLATRPRSSTSPASASRDNSSRSTTPKTDVLRLHTRRRPRTTSRAASGDPGCGTRRNNRVTSGGVLTPAGRPASAGMTG